MIPVGILGWTGLVGQTLYHQLLSTGIDPADIATYNTTNFHEVRGASFGTLYIACMPAEKWRANLNPAQDRDTLNAVLEALGKVESYHVVLLSTVDVLQSGNEHSTDWTTHAYGRHRRELEEWVRARWPAATILRLPALFGRGLKKNALYDLLHSNNLGEISLDATYQWYNLARLLKDCYACMKNEILLAHFCSPPIPMREIVEQWFADVVEECHGTSKVAYDLQTTHGGTLEGHYTCSREFVLAEMGAWIAWERWRLSHTLAVSYIGFTMSRDMNAVLRHVGITALEVAPTRGTDWGTFKPVCMQSLLYGTGIQNVFEEATATLDHLEKLMASARDHGVTRFVFGCPRQRDLTVSETEAQDFFRRVGDLGASHGITVCIEPNSRAYECKWLNTVDQTLRFIHAVGHPYIRLSLDTGNCMMEGDGSFVPIEYLGHVQISAEHLASRLTPRERKYAQTVVEDLWSRNYQGAISWEAREGTVGEACRSVGQFMDLLESAFHVHK